MDNLIKDFLAQKIFAVVGASSNEEKYGNIIFKYLVKKGYKVYPVNPRLDMLDGVKVYPSLSAIPEKVDVVDVVVPPKLTGEVVKECKQLGLTRVWMQPGAESEAAVKYCQENGIAVIHDACVMMH
ncbi:MAG: CoA-binding protein [Candidatus Firestonebacteria bacterium]